MSSRDPGYPISLHQPFVHDLVGVLHAPLQAFSRADGSMTGAGAEGIYLGDTRVLSDLELSSSSAQLSPFGPQVRSAREVEFRDVVSLADGVGDPLVVLHRTRTVDADGIGETWRLASDDDRPRMVSLRLELRTDGASMSAIKDPRLLARTTTPRPQAVPDGEGVRWAIGENGGCARLRVVAGETGRAVPIEIEGSVLQAEITLTAPPHGEDRACWRLELSDPTVPFRPVRTPWTALRPTMPACPSPDPESAAVHRLLESSLADLDALRLCSPDGGNDTFFAAGAPWYFTLFGRDSLIAASLVLPVDREVAAGTLRVLASRQGTRTDAETAEQPGKILHEVRAVGMDMGETYLPPVYYGTIDATPLWIELLHEARTAGVEIETLRPALVAAATWLLEHADADGDGLLEYVDESGHGLANQGWKDSGDAIRRADGSLATGAIALAEVQGYAHAAALHAAQLLEETPADSDLPTRLRDWAGRLHDRFHATFWCEDELGPYLALALDGEKRPVDGVASNMGHLLGTGLLDPDQERTVVARLLHPTLFSGYGIRTLSTDNGGYGPLRYHGGSVWTHDTAVILRGMLRSGFTEEARVLARALLHAAAGFDQRLPELFSGEPATDVAPPVPYPASCRPQAWAAASAVPIARALGVLPVRGPLSGGGR